MKRYLSGLFTGIALTTLVGSLVIGASAISTKMTIEVDPINIQVNGQTFAPTDVNGKEVPVFAYQGTTYAPLRALAEAYGLQVGYDQAANMATVTDPEVKPTATPAPDTTAKNDYSDWSAEEEAAYQEFKEKWELTFSEEWADADGAFWIYTIATDDEDTYNFANSNRYENPYMLRFVHEISKDLKINRFRVNVDGINDGYFLYFEDGALVR